MDSHTARVDVYGGKSLLLYAISKVTKSFWQKMMTRNDKEAAHRHGKLSNAIEEHDQGGKEAEACNLLAVIGGDRVDVGS